MKVKLLKKVRKRFEIHIISEVGRFAGENYKEAAKKWGLPFYIVYDTYEYMEYRTVLCKDKETAIEEIRKYIRLDYKNIRNTKKAYKSTKIWHI